MVPGSDDAIDTALPWWYPVRMALNSLTFWETRSMKLVPFFFISIFFWWNSNKMPLDASCFTNGVVTIIIVVFEWKLEEEKKTKFLTARTDFVRSVNGNMGKFLIFTNYKNNLDAQYATILVNYNMHGDWK